MKRRKLAFTGLVLTFGLLGACASGSGDVEASGNGPGENEANGAASSEDVSVSLIVKNIGTPWFSAMIEAVEEAAEELNVNLTVAGGRTNGDTQTQIKAIENAVARGDDGIVIAVAGSAVNQALEAASEAGLYIIAVDSPPDPIDIADIVIGTDNEAATTLIGEQAAAQLEGERAVIAMLNAYHTQIVPMDVQRNHGFLKGMGIDPGSETEHGKASSTGQYSGGAGGEYEIVCELETEGSQDGARQAMENCISRNPEINVVYAHDEQVAEGAVAAIQAAGIQDQVRTYTIDGNCQGVQNVKEGNYEGLAMQFPAQMGVLGLEAVVTAANGGDLPEVTPGKDFFATETPLVTANDTPGIASIPLEEAEATCWG